ncbi:MAG: hypothetical protein L0241_07975 [Planctomycetia bacterium]|nr:hypothetical protein [Planctomycetia bacterium]
MKRLVIAAVAVSLWLVDSARANDGMLAPTAPVVPAPFLQDGKLIGNPGSWSGPARNSRMVFSPTRWFSTRETALSTQIGSDAPPALPTPPVVTTPQYALPALPNGVGGPDGNCGQGQCQTSKCRTRGLSCERLKAWLCYHPSKTELPKFHPTPYITPLQGMFLCSSWNGCGSGCGTGGFGYLPPVIQPQPPPGPPMPPPTPPSPPMQPPEMLPPQPPGVGGAGAVVMPPRGLRGASVLPTWQGRTPSVSASESGIPGYRFATPHISAKPSVGPVVNTVYKK